MKSNICFIISFVLFAGVDTINRYVTPVDSILYIVAVVLSVIFTAIGLVLHKKEKEI